MDGSTFMKMFVTSLEEPDEADEDEADQACGPAKVKYFTPSVYGVGTLLGFDILVDLGIEDSREGPAFARQAYVHFLTVRMPEGETMDEYLIMRLLGWIRCPRNHGLKKRQFVVDYFQGNVQLQDSSHEQLLQFLGTILLSLWNLLMAYAAKGYRCQMHPIEITWG